MSQITRIFPQPLQTRLQKQLGDEFSAFNESLSAEIPTSIRLNPGKPIESIPSEMAVPWCSDGRYLDVRPNFTKDPLFHAGTYYVQEASSMFPAYLLGQILDLSRDMRILDLSAAPGGKSTLIQSVITENSLLVANEIISSRNKTLQQNLARWGGDNHIITQSDPRFFNKLPEFFDVILVDAPCSGEGLLRKDPTVLKGWSKQNVELCAARQRRILADSLPALAPGGILIYSTCTFSKRENEDNVQWLLQETELDPVEVAVPAEWGIQMQYDGVPAYRFYPHRLKGEGFFLAVFKKSEKSYRSRGSKKTAKPKLRFEKASEEDSIWLSAPERYQYFMWNDQRIAIPKELGNDLQMIAQALRITYSGLNLGKLYPGGLKPSPELALSQYVSPEIPRIELKAEQSLDYLSHINIPIDTQLNPGRYLVSHRGYGLGWLNKLRTGQIRNNYPSAWRILHRH